jgi:hypothetical protein
MQLSWDQARALGIKLPTVSKPKRAKKPPPPDSYTPHDCVILAIDPGNVSGWAIVSPRRSAVDAKQSVTVWSGRTTAGPKNHIVEMARDAATNDVMRPLIVVAETWTTGDPVHDRRMRAATMLGLGAAWGRWSDALDAVGVPKSRILRVNTSTWRAKIIGGPMNRTTEEWKRLALLHAQQRFPVRAPSGQVSSDDEAEALCIAAWAMCAGPVGEAVKKAGKRYP